MFRREADGEEGSTCEPWAGQKGAKSKRRNRPGKGNASGTAQGSFSFCSFLERQGPETVSSDDKCIQYMYEQQRQNTVLMWDVSLSQREPDLERPAVVSTDVLLPGFPPPVAHWPGSGTYSTCSHSYETYCDTNANANANALQGDGHVCRQ